MCRPFPPVVSFILLAGLLLSACRTEAPPETFEPLHPGEEPDLEADDRPPADEEEEVGQVRDHRLTMEEIRRYGAAAESVHRMALEEPELATIEDLESRLARAQSLEDVQRVLDEHPRVQQALSRAGITTRDYVLTGTALLGAYTYILMVEHGIPEPYRPEYVATHHIRFIEQNRAEVDQLVGRLQALYEDEG